MDAGMVSVISISGCSLVVSFFGSASQNFFICGTVSIGEKGRILGDRGETIANLWVVDMDVRCGQFGSGARH
jgi:hypothetical protein